MQDDGERERDPDRDRHVEHDRERIAGMGVDEFLPGEEGEDRLLEQREQIELEHQEERQPDADHEREERPDDAPAQLLEVIEERHLEHRLILALLRHPAPPYCSARNRSFASAASSERGYCCTSCVYAA